MPSDKIFMGLVIGCLAQVGFAGQLPASTFTVDLEGWSSNAPTLTHQAAGGNPGGFLRFFDNNSVATYLSAPAAFHGGYIFLGGVGVISMDVAVIATGTFSKATPVRILLSGPSGAATWVGPNVATLVGEGWVTIRAPLIESLWNVNSGTWPGLLAEVTSLRITADPFTTTSVGEVMGFDNIALLACAGDTNGDIAVDFSDLNAVLSMFGQTGANLPADLNADGTVDFADLNAVLSAFGSSCG